MGQPPNQPVATTPYFVIPGNMDAALSTPVTLFTVPLSVPSRVDAIYMSIVPLDIPSFKAEQYGIQYQTAGGVTLAQVWTPQYDSDETVVGTISLSLTFMRMGNGIDQLAFPPLLFTDTSGDGVGLFVGTYALPDMVLQPDTLVQVIRGTTAISGAVGVSDAAVTYTPGGLGTSTTEAGPYPEPYLIPTTG